MKNEKSAALDGFTVEFFNFFWTDLKFFILRSMNYGYHTGSLSLTQKQGFITCLSKPNKPRHYLKNWRPISLLNVVYKLASSAISNRLKTVLDKLINQDQKLRARLGACKTGLSPPVFLYWPFQGGTSVVVPYCSCCLCLYFGSSIMLVTYFVNFR